MSEEKYWSLMGRYLADGLSLRETEDLLQWLESCPSREGLLKELQETWDKSKNYPQRLSVDTDAAWLKVKRTVSDVNPPGIASRYHRIWLIALAALLSVIIIAAFFFLALR